MRDDPNYPVYQGDTEKSGESRIKQQFSDSRRLVDGLSDKIYFVFAGLASLWLAVVSLTEAVHLSWWSVLFILIFWGLASYLTLPRMHRILTNIYVPDYFFGRTQTSDGLLGDPVNLSFKAEEDDIHEAMTNAGWTKAENVSLKSSWRIVVSSLRKSSYPEAPVSPLMLFGRKQDFAYQQEVGGNPSKRHHVRFWKTPKGWKLPGGLEVDWLAAATYDHAVGLSLFTFQVTHKVDPDTDQERDYVVSTLEYKNPGVSHETLNDFMGGYNSRNGGGDHINTDGNLPIVDLDEVVPGDHETEQAKDPDHKHRNLSELAKKAPPDVWIAAGLVSLVALLQLGRSLFRIFSPGVIEEADNDLSVSARNFVNDTGNDLWNYALTIVTIGVTLVALFQVLLAINVVRGHHRARQINLAFLGASFIVVAIQIVTDTADSSNVYAVFVLMASQVFAMLSYTSDEAVNYTWASSQEKRRAKEARRNSGRRTSGDSPDHSRTKSDSDSVHPRGSQVSDSGRSQKSEKV
ncbi:LssY C-terminal domain-containing protein [Kocuria sp. TGY1127_2]|uniref:LssY C-terminal domain-containing protein n=1 Tax=Kocuria sp. TGY1127_2 TaxID=2711328 RepID=UPI0015BC9EB7|nr:LssY C-terminal domain-containing protein [Kocuria sp. TGY1127_2]